MHHTRESFQRNRGLALIILVLSVVWLMEPATGRMFEVCYGILQKFGGAQ